MMKIHGKEVPASLFKFYMADAIIPKLEFIRVALGMQNNSEVFSKLVLHVYGELKQFQDWHDKKAAEGDPEC